MYCSPEDFLCVQNEEINEQIYVTEGQYMVGIIINTRIRYHLKLKNKSIVCGYENMKGYQTDYSYKALTMIRGYTLRK